MAFFNKKALFCTKRLVKLIVKILNFAQLGADFIKKKGRWTLERPFKVSLDVFFSILSLFSFLCVGISYPQFMFNKEANILETLGSYNMLWDGKVY